MTAGTSSAAIVATAATVAPHTLARVCDRVSRMYPHVNEEECPLARAWSHQDKFTYLGLSQNNLRVHYKGVGKSHKDAASVRATHPIPPACGLYYFEVKVVSKGRDGYIGIGLCAQGVNMNKLPGWEKSSYGYHADDGNSFCSSGAGESYGPTFTTGDVIGCGVNFVNNTCFYTKNGINLGIAFRDLIPNLYPTVGLQTLGEIVDVNFGQQPFMFDIDEMRKELSANTMQSINNFPTPSDDASWKATMQKIVSSYLVHRGYSATVEAFSKASGQSVDEDISSIRNRQRVQKLVLAGRMSEAIDETNNLYPGLLEKNTNLMFQLKCRQFVEMVSGSDGEAKPLAHSPTRSTRNSPAVSILTSPSISTRNSPCASPARTTGTSLLTTTTADSSGNGFLEPVDKSVASDDEEMDVTAEEYITSCQSQSNGATTTVSLGNSEHVGNGVCGGGGGGTGEQEMMMSEEEEEEEGLLMASSSSPGVSILQRSQSDSGGGSPSMRQLCGGNLFVIEKLLAFGKSLQETYDQLARDHGPIPECETIMKEAFSLLAYNNPHDSPVAHLLKNEQREVVSTTLNSAILECHSFPRQPPLLAIIGQSHACLKAMAQHGLGSCAFVNTDQLYQPV